MKLKNIFFQSILVQLFLIIFIDSSVAQLIKVTDNYRISHPAYEMQNIWHGTGLSPWNRDYTRILLLENKSADTTHFPAAEIGRNLVWGFIDDTAAVTAGKISLKTLGQQYANNQISTDEWYKLYRDNTSRVSTVSSNYPYEAYMAWSNIAGEEHIIYALKISGTMVVKFDTNTLKETNIISYNPGDGTSISEAAIGGWTSDGKLVVFFNGVRNPTAGYLVDVSTGTRILFSTPAKCTEQWAKFPKFGGIHGDSSADRKYRVRYSASSAGFDNGAYISDWQDPNCNDGDYYACTAQGVGGDDCPDYGDVNNGSDLITHIAWGANNEWFVGGNLGDYFGTYSGINHESDTVAPYIDKYHRIVQAIFDRTTNTFTHNILLSDASAGLRGIQVSGQSNERNYSALPSPVLRPDSSQIMFTSTSGKYSKADYEDCVGKGCASYVGANNWGTIGIKLADLASVSGSQSCTSFTYSDWGACQSNNTQTRTVTSSSPSGCTGGTPVLTQSCTYSSAPALTILKTTSAPTIDGNLTEYNNANSITFSPDSGGNTVTVKSLWTSEALYLGINVTDTQMNASVTTRDGSVWNEDSIEWFIDTYYDGGGSSTPNSAFMRVDDYQGIVSILNTKYDSQGTTSGTPSSSWNGTWNSAVRLSGTQNNNADTDNSYTIEIKIPWTSIGYSSAPSSDTLLGMSFAINDKDSGGTYSKMWLSSAGSNQNASNWQRILLSGTLTTADVVPPAPPGALMIR